MGKSRFTIINEENNDQEPILISQSLHDRLKQKKKLKQQQQQQGSGAGPSGPSGPQIPTSGGGGSSPLVNEEPILATTGSSIFTEGAVPKFGGGGSSSSGSEYQPIYPELPPLDSEPTRFDSKFQQQQQPERNFGSSTMGGGPSSRFDQNYLLLELRNEYEYKLKQYQSMWEKNLDEMERLNKDLLKKNKELFSQKSQRVFEDNLLLKKYFDGKTPSDGQGGGSNVDPGDQPCKNIEEKLIRCLKVNDKRSLMCNDLIKQFTNCIDQARMDMLKQK